MWNGVGPGFLQVHARARFAHIDEMKDAGFEWDYRRGAKPRPTTPGAAAGRSRPRRPRRRDHLRLPDDQRPDRRRGDARAGPTRSTTTGPPTSPSSPIPNRMFPLAIVPNNDPEGGGRRGAALRQDGPARAAISRFKRMSMPALPPRLVPAVGGGGRVPLPDLLPLHRLQGRCARPTRRRWRRSTCYQWRLVRSALFQLDTMEVLVSIIASGACEKYPDFNFVLGESGVTWLPYVFDRLDTEYEDRARSLGFKLKPSDYFRRQGYVTYQQDQYLEPIVPLIGEDNIIWGADYPHPDCAVARLAHAPREEPRQASRARAPQDHLRQRGQALQPPLRERTSHDRTALEIPVAQGQGLARGVGRPRGPRRRLPPGGALRLGGPRLHAHLARACPGTEDQFLINPYGVVLRRDHRLQPGQDRPRRQQGRRTRRSR